MTTSCNQRRYFRRREKLPVWQTFLSSLTEVIESLIEKPTTPRTSVTSSQRIRGELITSLLARDVLLLRGGFLIARFYRDEFMRASGTLEDRRY